MLGCEAGKHYLLMGYAVIRRALLELDRRFMLNGGIWFLAPSDLPDLIAGKDLSAKLPTRAKSAKRNSRSKCRPCCSATISMRLAVHFRKSPAGTSSKAWHFRRAWLKGQL